MNVYGLLLFILLEIIISMFIYCLIVSKTVTSLINENENDITKKIHYRFYLSEFFLLVIGAMAMHLLKFDKVLVWQVIIIFCSLGINLFLEKKNQVIHNIIKKTKSK